MTISDLTTKLAGVVWVYKHFPLVVVRNRVLAGM